MKYEGAIYRPPSEAYSLLIQVTIGCSHNKCTFCSMYKDKQFRIRSYDDIKTDIESVSNKQTVEKIFLCDGDALAIPTNILINILKLINENFPNCKRVSCYATFQDLSRKSLEELQNIYNNGLSLLYLGAETGSNKVLDMVNKGVNSQLMIETSKKAQVAKMKLSIMLISGLGGQKHFHEHALESAQLINKINPDYLGLLSLMIQADTKLFEDVQNGVFKPITPLQTIEETKIIVETLNVTNCFFSSSHISNYLHLKGHFPEDKDKLLKEINHSLDNPELLNYGYKGL